VKKADIEARLSQAKEAKKLEEAQKDSSPQPSLRAIRLLSRTENKFLLLWYFVILI
jgi:hypothetical protein